MWLGGSEEGVSLIADGARRIVLLPRQPSAFVCSRMCVSISSPLLPRPDGAAKVRMLHSINPSYPHLGCRAKPMKYLRHQNGHGSRIFLAQSNSWVSKQTNLNNNYFRSVGNILPVGCAVGQTSPTMSRVCHTKRQGCCITFAVKAPVSP